MPDWNRLRAYEITPEDLCEILTGAVMVVPFPEGIRIMRYAVKWERNSAVLIVWHPEFDEVPEGHPIDLNPLPLKIKP